MRRALFASSFAAVVLAAPLASAFCGFYVAGTDQKLYADATQVVLMRDGTKTVLSMQNDYKGPPEKFALVIPVPVVLQKDQVKILPRDVFDKVDKLGSPRLVEYWEQDPCAQPAPGELGNAFGAGGLGLSGIGSGGGGRGDLGVKIEAQFTVGEYEIVILSAKDSGGLDTWLKQEKYAIPDGAEPYLKPYVQKGMKFFVAKVDPAKVTIKDGRATLSPIRFHYDDTQFTLPVRLGLINSSGTQDLVVNILAKHQRYEAANYPNVTIPTNLDVAEAAKDKFGEFYAALFDDTVAKHPKAVVTEYSWDAGNCDPCPGPTLDPNDLATLGADVIPQGTEGMSWGGGNIGLGGLGTLGRPVPSLKQGKLELETGLPPEVVQRIVRQNYGRFRLCYENGLRSHPTLGGSVKTSFTIKADGSVGDVKDAGGDLADKAVHACIDRAFANMSFPEPEPKKSIKATYEVILSPPPAVDASAPPPPPPRPVFFGSTPYVLTRLHVRYAKDSLGDDLVFKEAKPIVGGREFQSVKGGLEQGATESSTNSFQGRYAIRHPWTGPIACKEPRRGVWGGPPATEAGVAPPSGPISATKTAYVPRGQVTLTSFLAPAGSAAAASGGSAAPAPSSSATADGGAPAEEKKGGCAGCAVVPVTGGDSGIAAGLAIAIGACLRRLRARATRIRSRS